MGKLTAEELDEAYDLGAVADLKEHIDAQDAELLWQRKLTNGIRGEKNCLRFPRSKTIENLYKNKQFATNFFQIALDKTKKVCYNLFKCGYRAIFFRR